jgi:hypothetical protein
MDYGKDTIKTKGCKLLLDAFQFVGISRRNRFPKTETYSIKKIIKIILI